MYLFPNQAYGKMINLPKLSKGKIQKNISLNIFKLKIGVGEFILRRLLGKEMGKGKF